MGIIMMVHPPVLPPPYKGHSCTHIAGQQAEEKCLVFLHNRYSQQNPQYIQSMQCVIWPILGMYCRSRQFYFSLLCAFVRSVTTHSPQTSLICNQYISGLLYLLYKQKSRTQKKDFEEPKCNTTPADAANSLCYPFPSHQVTPNNKRGRLNSITLNHAGRTICPSTPPPLLKDTAPN